MWKRFISPGPSTATASRWRETPTFDPAPGPAPIFTSCRDRRCLVGRLTPRFAVMSARRGRFGRSRLIPWPASDAPSCARVGWRVGTGGCLRRTFVRLGTRPADPSRCRVDWINLKSCAPPVASSPSGGNVSSRGANSRRPRQPIGRPACIAPAWSRSKTNVGKSKHSGSARASSSPKPLRFQRKETALLAVHPPTGPVA